MASARHADYNASQLSQEKMNIWNDSYDDGRSSLSGRARAALFALASIALVGAGAYGLYRVRTPDEPETLADPAPVPEHPAPAPIQVAAAKPGEARLALTPAPDAVLQDEEYRDAVADAPKVGKDERLKDAVGDFRLLKPGGDKVPQTTIGKSGPTTAWNWTGPYAGVVLGAGIGKSSMRTSVASPPDYFLPQDIGQIGDLGSRNATPLGFVGGVEGGYNYQVNSVVFGLEGDLDALQLSQHETQTGNYNSSPANTFSLSQHVSTDWLATLRPRAGVVLDKTLVFATAGAAVTKFKYDEEFTDTFSPALARQSMSETRVGWTVGGGAEYSLQAHWSLKAEYLYADFGKISTTSMLTAPAGKTDVFAHSATFNVHIVRLGLNYRF